MRPHTLRRVTTLTLTLAVAACAPQSDDIQDKASEDTIAPHDMLVTARDFTFAEAPDTVPAGPTNVRLLNEGTDFHHVVLIRLEQGKTIDELLQHLGTAHGKMPSWAVELGGPNSPRPGGGESAAVVDLTPGNYAMLCVVPATDGQLHLQKGMVRPLVVVPNNTGRTPQVPTADVVMTLADYTFTTSAPIAAGRRTIRLENVAEQAHEVILAKLEPGKTAQDLLSFIEKRQGPPPGMPLGGVTGIGKGQVNYITADFQPGEYVLICLYPDINDNLPHAAHGMVKQFTVS